MPFLPGVRDVVVTISENEVHFVSAKVSAKHFTKQLLKAIGMNPDSSDKFYARENRPNGREAWGIILNLDEFEHKDFVLVGIPALE